MFRNVLGRNLNEWNTAVKEHLRGHDVLAQVELSCRRPFVRGTAEPDHDNLVLDLRLHQNRGRDVDRTTDGQYKEGTITRLHRLVDEVSRGWTIDRTPLFLKEPIRTAKDGHTLAASEEVEQPEDLLVALLHAVGRAGGTVIDVRCSVDRLDVHLFGREQAVGHCVLIVDLVVRVGVEHGPHAAAGERQHPIEVRRLCGRAESDGARGGSLEEAAT